jgi:hypothetical protein
MRTCDVWCIVWLQQCAAKGALPSNSPETLPAWPASSQDMLEGLGPEEIAELPPFPFPKELFPPGGH